MNFEVENPRVLTTEYWDGHHGSDDCSWNRSQYSLN